MLGKAVGKEETMRGLHRSRLLALALVWIGIGPAAACAEVGHRTTRTVRIAALLDLEGAQASLGRPAMNGFVLGLQQGSSHGALSFSALLDTRSDPEVTASAAREVVPAVSIAAGFTPLSADELARVEGLTASYAADAAFFKKGGAGFGRTGVDDQQMD